MGQLNPELYVPDKFSQAKIGQKGEGSKGHEYHEVAYAFGFVYTGYMESPLKAVFTNL